MTTLPFLKVLIQSHLSANGYIIIQNHSTLKPWRNSENTSLNTTLISATNLFQFTYTRFVTPVALSQHLINNHKDSFVDFSGDVEIEKLNSGKDGGEVDIFLKEKINRDDALVDEKVKYEVSPASHTARLSYRDVLVKGSVNENAANTSPINYEEGFKLYFEAAEAISTLMEERKDEIDDDYDYDSDNYDNVPEVPKGHLTEEEEDKLFWETICDVCKGTEAVTMMRKARKMLGMPI
ncbi:unnamed protein product [Rhizophagus irregularis]|nr:unnamed protein product [Rhizophagus irregularis]